jgi:uncharacterized protein (TIGR02145 family)
MKKLILTLIAIVAMLAAVAQAPNAFNYQTAVRNADGNIIADQSVAFQISILQGATDGTAVYVETHNATTSVHGLVNFQIGGGTSTDDFSAIDWAAGPYFVKVDLDAAGGTTFIEMGTSQLLSVPYAKYAETTGNAAALMERLAVLEEMNGIGTITDIDGNQYEITKIGNQIWMAENLRVTKYADGTPIPQVTDNTEWMNLGDDDKAFCWWENDSATYAESYGAYYTFAAANNGNVTSDSAYSTIQGVCPDGWHVPSRGEWYELENYLGNVGHAGNEGTVLKSTAGWDADGNGTDLFGFEGTPNGLRVGGSAFSYQGTHAIYKSSSENGSSGTFVFYLQNTSNEIFIVNEGKSSGINIRCVKNQ